MDKHVVTISKYWNSPKIFTKITSEEISLEISLDDFREALKKEIGSVATVLTKVGIEQRIDKSFNSIIERIKEETVKIAHLIPIGE